MYLLNKIKLKHIGYGMGIAIVVLNFWFYRFDLHAYIFDTGVYYAQPAFPYLMEWPTD